MHDTIRSCLGCERGSTAIEYGLIVGLVAVIIVTSASLLGMNLEGIFQTLADAL